MHKSAPNTVNNLGKRSSTRPPSLLHRVCGTLGQLLHRHQAETALRNAKENAEDATRAAEAANRAKTELLAKTSHEIRTPMNGVPDMIDLPRQRLSRHAGFAREAGTDTGKTGAAKRQGISRRVPPLTTLAAPTEPNRTHSIFCDCVAIK